MGNLKKIYNNVVPAFFYKSSTDVAVRDEGNTGYQVFFSQRTMKCLRLFVYYAMFFRLFGYG